MEPFLTWIEAHQGLAAWFQAIASVVAIVAAAGVAVWVPARERRETRWELARIVNTLANGAALGVQMQAMALASRQAVYNVATGVVPLGLDRIKALERSFNELPLHATGDAALAQQVLFMRAELERFCQSVELILKRHAELNAEEFDAFLNYLKVAVKSTHKYRDEIAGIASRHSKNRK